MTIPHALPPGHMRCEACEGEGRVKCVECEGDWECARECECRECGNTHTTNCEYCDEGEVNCSACEGEGVVDDPDYVLPEGI